MENLTGFINGFTSWHQTHFEISGWIALQLRKESPAPCVSKRYDANGTGGMYELAKELTNEFEELHAYREWDGDYFDELESFLDTKASH